MHLKDQCIPCCMGKLGFELDTSVVKWEEIEDSQIICKVKMTTTTTTKHQVVGIQF